MNINKIEYHYKKYKEINKLTQDSIIKLYQSKGCEGWHQGIKDETDIAFATINGEVVFAFTVLANQGPGKFSREGVFSVCSSEKFREYKQKNDIKIKLFDKVTSNLPALWLGVLFNNPFFPNAVKTYVKAGFSVQGQERGAPLGLQSNFVYMVHVGGIPNSEQIDKQMLCADVFKNNDFNSQSFNTSELQRHNYDKIRNIVLPDYQKIDPNATARDLNFQKIYNNVKELTKDGLITVPNVYEFVIYNEFSEEVRNSKVNDIKSVSFNFYSGQNRFVAKLTKDKTSYYAARILPGENQDIPPISALEKLYDSLLTQTVKNSCRLVPPIVMVWAEEGMYVLKFSYPFLIRFVENGQMFKKPDKNELEAEYKNITNTKRLAIWDQYVTVFNENTWWYQNTNIYDFEYFDRSSPEFVYGNGIKFYYRIPYTPTLRINSDINIWGPSCKV